MVWKCPPLHLPNWNNLWKRKEQMTAYELADKLDRYGEVSSLNKVWQAARMLRQQADRIAELEDKLHWLVQHPVKQLSDEQIRALWNPMPDTKVYVSDLYAFARAIIKEITE